MCMLKQCLIGEDLGNAERGREGQRGACETHFIVAGYSKVIWDHPSSRGLCGRTHTCVYAHVCVLMLGGRLAGSEKHLLWTLGLLS